MDILDGTNRDLIALPYWPTCKNVLTWSAENLAVAAGEVVHILTPRSTAQSQDLPGHKHWHTATIRVNQFTAIEWPVQTLATLDHFSLGEELSESTISSIAWSPSGLSLYRRSVLAVLTSNLILSFWETNGRPGMWKRTAIVNRHLLTDPNMEQGRNVRRKLRARAFAWLPSLQISTHAKSWGRHILVVADDDFSLLFFEVSKAATSEYGHWSFRTLGRHRLEGLDHLSSKDRSNQSLSSILARTTPISSLQIGEWQIQEASKGTPAERTICVRVSLGQCCDPRDLLLHILEPRDGSVYDDSDVTLSVQPLPTPNKDAFPTAPLEIMFDPVIQSQRIQFDTEHNLAGRVRLARWGSTWSSDRTVAATCVSLHPLDMIGHVIPSRQRILVLLVRQEENLSAEVAVEDPINVQERIFQFIRDASQDSKMSTFDKKILRASQAAMEMVTSPGDVQDSQLSQQHLTLDSEPEGTENPAQADRMSVHGTTKPKGNTTDPEICELCNSLILFTSDLAHAKCFRGHLFTRCSLSHVAIQEPGISKYCSQCGRQFLDHGKMELTDHGPSLAQALFDKFDVCPYCHAKFRG